MDVLSLSAAELLERYRSKQLSPVEVTRAALDRIARLQPIYNAFVTVGEREALQAARDSEARWMRGAPAGLVDGLPTTVKDLLLVKGWPTLRGSRTVDPNQPWDEDSAAVARMREQGAVFLGKTTTPEFGWKGVTDSPLTGLTVNPWDVTKTPGGSSGGAAVAAACGMGVHAYRHRRRRLDPDSRWLLRPVRLQADLRPGSGPPASPARNVVAPRPDHAHGARRCADADGHFASRRARLLRRSATGHRLSPGAGRRHPRHAHRLQPHARLRHGRRGGGRPRGQSRG